MAPSREDGRSPVDDEIDTGTFGGEVVNDPASLERPEVEASDRRMPLPDLSAEGPYPGKDGGGRRPLLPEPQEEWATGPLIWVAVLVFVLVRWLWSTRSHSSSGGSGSSASAKAQRPDADEMRRRRLEALQRGTAAASAEGQSSATTVSSDSSDTLRRRQAKHDVKSELVPAEGQPVPERTAPSATVTEQTKQVVDPAPSTSCSSLVTTEDPKPKTSQSASDSQVEAAVPKTFGVKVRCTIRGVSTNHDIGSITPRMSVGELRDVLVVTLCPGESVKLRLFCRGKELKEPDAILGKIGIGEGAMLQAMFLSENSSLPAPAQASSGDASAEDPATAKTLAPAPEPVPPSVAKDDVHEVLVLRIQGNSAVHNLEMKSSENVLELEERIMEAFDSGDDNRLRLFYMGKELKDADSTLRSLDLKKSGSTVQVLFVPGKPRGTVKRRVASMADTPTASAALGDTETTEAVMAAAAAAGCNPAALAGISSAASSDRGVAPEIIPEKSWEAVLKLEAQLRRATDEREDSAMRTAAGLLREMLRSLALSQSDDTMRTAQSLVPDLSQIWNFEPTRDYLRAIVGANPSQS